MTEIEKLEAEQRAVQDKLAAARQRATEDSLRESFTLMLQDGVPIRKIIAEAVGRQPLRDDELAKFADRLAHFVKIHT